MASKDDGYLMSLDIDKKTYHISHYGKKVYYSTSKKTGGTELKNVEYRDNTLYGWIDKKWYKINDFQLARFIQERNESSSGCFISTAVYYALNQDDNCYELELLRKFRDNFLLNDEEYAKLVYEYYEIAPSIAKNLNAKNDQHLYQYILDNYLMKVVQSIEHQENEQAIQTYQKMVEFLQKEIGNIQS